MNGSLPPALVEYMRQHQYRPERLKPSGNGFLRFPVGQEINGNASGYVKLFFDGESAVFGDFKSGMQAIWSARDVTTLLPAERKAHREALKKAREGIQEEQRRLQVAAADKAAEIYSRAGNAKADHPYLVKKGVSPRGGVKQLGKQLIVPVYIEDELTSLQFIKEDGTKRFLSGGEIRGGCCMVGTPAKVLCIAEGYATGCSIHEATGHAVAVAFTAGNLMHVAQAMRQRYNEATLILCSDNDQWTEGNPGLTKAAEAAKAIGGLLAVPDFSGGGVSTRPTDFNDMHALTGKEAVEQAISAARKVDNATLPGPGPQSIAARTLNETIESVRNGADADYFDFQAQFERDPEPSAGAETLKTGKTAKTRRAPTTIKEEQPEVIRQEGYPPAEEEADAPLAPPRMPDMGFPPLISDIVDVACRSSEAHPVAVAANILTYFSAIIGRGVFQHIGDAIIHCRPFPLIVGKSGKARKGTSESTVRKIFRCADAIISRRRGIEECLRCHIGGLSTGEGIAWAIRDPVEAEGKQKGDPGVADKRLLVIESEFDNVLAQLRRDNNTLSATIRNLFDGRDIEPLTKTSRTRATRPHVSILGHITSHELREKATANDVANGLLNRFIILHVYRPKLVALPCPTPEAKIEELAQRVADAVMAVTEGNVHADNVYEVTFSDTARELWEEQYPTITRDREGKAGSLLARSEMYARMLAMIFAAMDGRLVIESQDLHAAIAWVEYWNSSVTYIFNCRDDEGGLDPFVAEVLEVITRDPGITLTKLRKHWPKSRKNETDKALETLLSMAPPLIEQEKAKTDGRSPTKYFRYEEK
ncbi:DUF3987 domain-containing protein [Nitrosospira sp. Is2]|uniref:DUF3987 domain-containing protein n=1 Tax=Nitrosospira sp. Is2 TaxID=3080532 RepID=UPI0029557507|nr:DUF3987 domain-containing protein [Nitrosospira sp. Is2]WON74467.1 DUF3987 domain-containing protein [Nitrosospira sp. Is2]